MAFSKQRSAAYLHIGEILYLTMLVLSFSLLLTSRTGEARTVWEVLNPFFLPALFVTSLILVTILFTSEKVVYKLLFIIVHSILIHSFFSIIFPAGDLSGQQIILGRTRLVFDNATLHGWTPWPWDLQSQVYEWFRGTTFQSALSVVFARMLSVDLLWVHLFLVPILWGVFVPIATFLITKAVVEKEEIAVLSSAILSAFPYATYFGAISVPYSLGFIFFLYSILFILRSFNSDSDETKFLILIFSFFSFISHFLTGVISFSALILALAFQSYNKEKTRSPITSKVLLVIAFLFCVSLVPLSLIYLRFLTPTANTVFTLDKFYEMPIREIAGLFLIGELIYGFALKTIILVAIAPALALICMIYLIYSFKRGLTTGFHIRILFLFAAFLMIIIDYRILKLFMHGVPFNEERLWLFQDLIAAPFVGLAIFGVFSSIKDFLVTRFPPTVSIANLKKLSKGGVFSAWSLMLTLNILIPALLAGWITFSLSAAYPQVAPLQTTWYELEAVKFIEENTHEKYVVVGDQWTIFAGEVIVGVNNPRAYYFLEFNQTGYDLFRRMRDEPSSEVMIKAMNVNNATVAYFIVTEPRLGTQEFNRVVSQAQENQQLRVFSVFGAGKLYIFSYKKGD